MAKGRRERAAVSFAELKADWEAKLKAEGLGETLTSGNPYRSGSVGHNSTTWQAKVEYFAALGRSVHDYTFKKRADRIIMEMRADGKLTSEITKELNRLGVPRCEQTVRYTIRRYEHLWGIRKWTNRERRQP